MKPIFTYLVCFFIFCLWLRYEQNKSKKSEQKATDDFWATEYEANHTRNKDYSDLPILHVKESEIPVAESAGEAVQYNISRVLQIIKNPMADLSEYSNTELKLAYGVGNFKLLSEYDENFNQFLTSLTNLARSYEKEGLLDTARDTYLLALRYGSKRASDFTELAKIYVKLNQPEKISQLIRETESGTHPRKDSVIAALREILAACQ